MWEKVSQETDISGSFFKEDGAVGGGGGEEAGWRVG